MQRLACELRSLREKAGSPTYREMARLTGLGASTLSQAAAGDRLPSLPVVLAYVRACGAGEEEWETRWRRTSAEEVAERPVPEADVTPYRGLTRFGSDDGELFFGRDQLIGDLLRLVRRRRITAVAGASGSGKSSLLRAGLIPALRDADPPGRRPAAIRILTPGTRPLQHAERLTACRREGDTVVVIDQFEEVFTVCADPAERTRFLDLLLSAADPARRLRVVIGVRADFVGRCAEHHGLAEALREATLLVGPMGPAELRDAIVKPAATQGCIVERALTARIIEDIADEPGGLPLMSHALLETWRRRRGRALTLAAYEAAGSVHGALARTAEELYARLTGEQASAARRILLRLITPGQGAQDTGRPARRCELQTCGEDETVALERLVCARLVTLDGETVTLAHESLIAAWPRLQAWVDADRDRLRIQRRLTPDAHTWQELHRDPGALYRGIQLTTAQDAFADHRADLTPLESAFLEAAADARRQEQHALSRATRRLRTLVGSLSFVLVLALVAGTTAWREDRNSAHQQVLAAAHRVVAMAEAISDSDPEQAMQLSLAAYRIADTDETRSALLGAMAQQNVDALPLPTEEPGEKPFLADRGRLALIVGSTDVDAWDIASRQEQYSIGQNKLELGGLGDAAEKVLAVSPDGSTIVSRMPNGSLQLWDAATQRRLGNPFGATSGTPVFGAGGRTLIVTGRDRSSGTAVQLWDVRRQRLLFERPVHSVASVPVAVSANDRFLAWCQDDGTLQLWDVGRNRRLPVHSTGPGTVCPGTVSDDRLDQAVQFSPDSRVVAVADDDGGVRRWDVASGRGLGPLEQMRAPLGEVSENSAALQAVTYSGDGKFLAGISGAGVTLWRVDRPTAPVWSYVLNGEDVEQLTLDTRTHSLRYVVPTDSLETASPFEPGATQVTSEAWSVRTLDLGRAVTGSWSTTPVVATALSGDGRATATLPADSGTARITVRDGSSGATATQTVHGLPPTPQPGAGTVPAPLLSFTADGRLLAYVTAPAGNAVSGAVGLWNTAERRVTAWFAPSSCGRVTGAVLSADGSRLAMLTACDADRTEIWDVPHHTRLRTLRDDGKPPLAFSPDAGLLVSLSPKPPFTVAGQSDLVDPVSGKATRVALGAGDDWSVAFSPDGSRLAVGDASGRITLWDGQGRRLMGFLPDFDVGGTVDDLYLTLAFSHQGRVLAVAGRQGRLQLWDTVTRRQIGADLATPGDPVAALAFGADDRTVYAQGTHTALQSYDITPQHAAAEVCARLKGDVPTPEEWRTYISDVPYRSLC